MSHFRVCLVVAALATFGPAALVARADTAPVRYELSDTLRVGGPGGWDYVTVDSANGLLYLPRTTYTLVLKESDGSMVANIPGQRRNHGVALVPAAGRGFITDGADGAVVVFDLNTYAVLGRIKVREDADGIIYDPSTNKVLVVCGDAGVLVPISPDVKPTRDAADPAIELGGKPEFLAADGTGRVYVNLVNKAEVAVVDLHTRKVLAHWPTAPGGVPVGMAIDRAHRRLFIGCRNPQKLLVMDCSSGKVVAALPLGRGNDAVKFDDGYALASCGDGTLTVAGLGADGTYQVLQTLRTHEGARTCGLDAQKHTLYLPTADFEPSSGKRPRIKPDSFRVLKVTREPVQAFTPDS